MNRRAVPQRRQVLWTGTRRVPTVMESRDTCLVTTLSRDTVSHCLRLGSVFNDVQYDVLSGLRVMSQSELLSVFRSLALHEREFTESHLSNNVLC